MVPVVVGIVALAVGIAAGFLIRKTMAASDAQSIEARAQKALLEAEREADATRVRAIQDAREESATIRREADEDVRARREEISRLESRILESETDLRKRVSTIESKTLELQERDEKLQFVREQLAKAADQHRAELERIAGMTSTEAREHLVAQVVEDAKRAAMTQVREIEQRAREEGDERARKIVTIAIQRVASEQTAESTVSVFALPSEDMKGRIIGREGRNIRAFEATTGVNLIVDDTPEAVVLSCFDPVRREAARMTLEKLVGDGRIHPARIEEIHERSLRELEEQIRRAGEDAVAEVGITDIHPELIKLLGRLQYRTSYGQNVLKHLVESAHIASALAAEIGVDGTIAKRGAFLHDIGKAVTHEIEGSHAIIGAEIARRLKEGPEVVHCIESHHGEVEQHSVDAVLAQIADSHQRRTPRRSTRVARDVREAAPAPRGDLHRDARGREDVCHAGRPGGPRDGQAGGRGRHLGAGDRPRHREAGRGGAAVPGTDQDHGGARDPGGGVRQVRGSLDPMERTYLIRTFGCQMNEHDSERIAGLLSADGMTPTDDVAQARVVVFNTCAIRENADNRLYGNLGHLKPLKDEDPSLRIVVAGCLAQKDQGEIQRRAPWVDIVVGTHALPHLLDLLRTSEREGPQMDVREYTEVFPSALPSARHDPFRAWVSIAPGCDNACTFCIVPLVRGPQRSRGIGDILAEVQGLARSGVVEVTLLGQNVNTYGRDVTVPGSSNRPLFGELLRQVGAVEGIRRVRFTSPHPHDFTPDVIEAMAGTPTVCEHIHFPLQSGSDRVLKAMRRSYRRDRYLGWLDAIRTAIPDVAVSTDVIVGFPGETEEDFADTLDLVERARFDSAYTFQYSPRPGTRAASFDDQVPKDVVQERFDRLVELQQRISLERSLAQVGATFEVLVEGVGKRGPSTQARTRTNRIVHIPAPLEAGTFVHARITEASAHHLAGELVPAPEAVAV